MKSDKYKTFLEKKQFGELTFISFDEIKSVANKITHKFHFVCSCGVRKDYTAHNVSKVFSGDTVSCGHIKKDKWRKSYYTWKKDWERRFGNE